MSDPKKSLEQRLENHPNIRRKVEALLDAVEDRSGDFDLADDIEEYLIEQMREIAREALCDWAVRKENGKVAELVETSESAKNHSKKNSGGTRLSDR